MLFINFSCSLLSIMVPILLSMAFFTLLERKILGYSHLRKGPNKVSFMGLLQPIADAMKLFLKQMLSTTSSNKLPFYTIPCLTLFLALTLWVLYPFPMNPLNFKHSMILFLALSSINVYTTLLMGWSSNSKYSLIGAMRGSAQTISYEVSLFLILLFPISMVGSYKLVDFSNYYILLLLLIPMFGMWMISLLAETNRTPFDLAEGESELVSGFNTEYGSGSFAFIFMAEYMNILFMATLSGFLFFNMTNNFIIFAQVMTILSAFSMGVYFIWTRTSFPRMRYDQLMNMTWKIFLPFLLAMLPIVFMIMLL